VGRAETADAAVRPVFLHHPGAGHPVVDCTEPVFSGHGHPVVDKRALAQTRAQAHAADCRAGSVTTGRTHRPAGGQPADPAAAGPALMTTLEANTSVGLVTPRVARFDEP